MPSGSAAAEQDPRIYFAAERTFLAWIRTGLALMGFGFVVARFGLFLRELRSNDLHFPTHATGLSLWLGTALVALGIVVNLSAAAHHVQLIRQLRSGTWEAGRISTAAFLVACFLALVGIAMVLYLLVVR